MKRLTALLLTVVLCAVLFTVNAGAALPPFDCGDVNWDGSFDSIDVTLTQRFLAETAEFDDEMQKPMADFDHDGVVTIFDVTWMQRSQAYMQIPSYIGGQAEYDFHITGFSASYDSGKAAVGVPITLSVTSENPYDPDGYMPLMYEFYADGRMIHERSCFDSLTINYLSAGTHTLQVKAYSWQGFSREASIRNYEVVESGPSDRLTFKSVRWKEKEGMSLTPTLITEAMGGTAPYTYSLKFYHWNCFTDGEVVGLTDEDVNAVNSYLKVNPDPLWSYHTDEDGRTYLYRDFSDATATTWSIDMFPWGGRYKVIAQAMDADGNLSESVTMEYMNDLMIG